MKKNDIDLNKLEIIINNLQNYELTGANLIAAAIIVLARIIHDSK